MTKVDVESHPAAGNLYAFNARQRMAVYPCEFLQDEQGSQAAALSDKDTGYEDVLAKALLTKVSARNPVFSEVAIPIALCLCQRIAPSLVHVID